jgi:hypothetical protein
LAATLTKEEAAAAENLFTVMERFRLVRPLMPVHLISAFLRVALNEGQMVSWYAQQS